MRRRERVVVCERRRVVVALTAARGLIVGGEVEVEVEEVDGGVEVGFWVVAAVVRDDWKWVRRVWVVFVRSMRVRRVAGGFVDLGGMVGVDSRPDQYNESLFGGVWIGT